jgi:hypothetical protein
MMTFTACFNFSRLIVFIVAKYRRRPLGTVKAISADYHHFFLRVSRYKNQQGDHDGCANEKGTLFHPIFSFKEYEN